MDLLLVEEDGAQVIEGKPDKPLLAHAADVRLILEACAGTGVHDVLLYAANLPPAFFDLSSGDAGEILQKLTQYQIRLAVVCPPGGVQFSTRFGDALAELRSSPTFRLFETRQTARSWLTAGSR